jgi:hypothetical protein
VELARSTLQRKSGRRRRVKAHEMIYKHRCHHPTAGVTTSSLPKVDGGIWSQWLGSAFLLQSTWTNWARTSEHSGSYRNRKHGMAPGSGVASAVGWQHHRGTRVQDQQLQARFMGTIGGSKRTERGQIVGATSS